MASNTERLDYGATGLTIYTLAFSRANGQVWNGTALEAYTPANYTNYDVAMPEISGSAIYLLTAPVSLPAGDYDFLMRVQAGASPSATDAPAGSASGHWDGTSLTPVAPAAAALLTPFQVGSLRFLRNRWTLIVGAGGERLRVYAEDGTTGDFSGLVTRDANLAIDSFTPDPSFVP